MEFFAGEGNVWKCVRCDQGNAVGLDLEYFHKDRNNPMDINSDAGLAFPPQPK